MITDEATEIGIDRQLQVSIILMLPDNRPRDVDNYAKAVLDAFTKAELWKDDSQIYRLVIEKMVDAGTESCIVHIEDYD